MHQLCVKSGLMRVKVGTVSSNSDFWDGNTFFFLKILSMNCEDHLVNEKCEIFKLFLFKTESKSIRLGAECLRNINNSFLYFMTIFQMVKRIYLQQQPQLELTLTCLSFVQKCSKMSSTYLTFTCNNTIGLTLKMTPIFGCW